jgi:hypothetical protein
MRIPPVHLAWKKPRPFWSLFAAPLASATAAVALDPSHFGYYLVSLLCAFFVLLSLIESFASGRIEDSWGRIEKSEHPIRFWLQIGLWIATWLCATVFPLTFCLTSVHR